MAKLSNMIVAVFISKTTEGCKPGWAFVSDFNSSSDFVKWFSERRHYYQSVSITEPGDFKRFEEIDEFKLWLRGMLNIIKIEGPFPLSWEKCEYYADLHMDMQRYEDKDFDKLIRNYRGF